MSRQLHLTHALSISAMVVTFSVSAQAGGTTASRTFVSTTGSDGNAALLCTAPFPCRTFTAASGVTSANGEIVAQNYGGYGPFTITNPMTIKAPNGAAITQAASGQNAITIDLATPGTVSISNVTLEGGGTGNDGILVEGSNTTTLILDKVYVNNFPSSGVEIQVPGNNLIIDSKFTGNGSGFLAGNAATQTNLIRDVFFGNAVGVSAYKGSLGITDSHILNNGTGVSVAGAGGASTTKMFRTLLNYNDIGLQVGAGGVGEVAGNYFGSNTTAAVKSVGGGTVTGTASGTNYLEPGNTVAAAVGTPVTNPW